MCAQVKNNINLLFLQFGEKFGFSRPELFLPSFTLRLVYKTPVSATDAFWLTLAALECQGNEDPVENFHLAMDALTCLFGQAFEVAVRRTKARAEFKYFDSHCIELYREDMLKFFEALATLLSS
ncbi:unnamed protein product [Dibothriocephalus latus]|uniref:Uncharacterized protein n=1 Tax=Dibothriocephalus latus TaxID=60516 RepID=A0A3P7KX09_DIBLA|nr:unnamed protein product [Dibothriocephalus latus]